MKNLKEQNNLREIKKEFNYRDPFLLEEQLFEDEILIRNTARDFATKELLPKIIEANPEAEFHIYYGMEETKINNEGQEMLKELLLQYGIYEHGRATYEDIAKEMQQSSFLLYYTSSPAECDCISVMEALCSGCIPIIWDQNIFSKFNGLQVSNDPRLRESYETLALKLIELMREDKERENVIDRFKNSPTIILGFLDFSGKFILDTAVSISVLPFCMS